ncbi:cysteine hydrolase family protein [Campylobacter sp. MG1]|uniref:cysteine hydrolase family protein n=1 Tax=Campylobacter sp. MG1 TaxID=2976332 RepID=UPI00226CDCFE|nr:cysteine hydrolase family protein [Campylobacter sp. MG1]
MKNLLIIVDFQNDFVSGSLGFENALKIENAIINKFKIYEKNNDDIVFTIDCHEDDYLSSIEGQNLPIKHCIKNTKGIEIYGALNDLSKNYKKFYKNTFGSLELANFIATKNYKNIELVGLVSNICVFSNAIMAKSASPNSNILIDASATSSNDLFMQKISFEVLKNLHIQIINDGL